MEMTIVREAVRARLDAYAARQLAPGGELRLPPALERDSRLRTLGGLDAVINTALTAKHRAMSPSLVGHFLDQHARSASQEVWVGIPRVAVTP